MPRLLDTCILIDYLRGREPAIAYLERLQALPAISVISVMELQAGIRAAREASQLNALFDAMDIYDVDIDIAHKAGDYLKKYTASHAIDPPDALIGATAECHGLQLITHNLKHFPMFGGLKRPYAL